MSLPLHGQGRPLPPDFPYTGEWLLEPRMFLYVSAEEQRGTQGKPQFTAEVHPTGKDWSFGFDATQLGEALGVAVDNLFVANHSGALTLESIEANTKTGDGATIKRYIFRLGEKEAAMVIEHLGMGGAA